MQRLARAERAQHRRQALLAKKTQEKQLEIPAMIADNEKVHNDLTGLQPAKQIRS
jgi:hypothetical protein